MDFDHDFLLAFGMGVELVALDAEAAGFIPTSEFGRVVISLKIKGNTVGRTGLVAIGCPIYGLPFALDGRLIAQIWGTVCEAKNQQSK